MNIRVEDVSYTYLVGTPQQKTALFDISLEVAAGERVAIAGVSGSGKSTLAQLMAGLLTPTRGRIFADGVPLVEAPRPFLERIHPRVMLDGLRHSAERKRAEQLALQKRSRIGYAFQYPETQLFEETVEADIAFGLRGKKLSKIDQAHHVQQVLEQVGLDPFRYARHNPRTLSGGEQRRVALAGILVMQPDVLILDEPSAGLDGRGRREIEEMLDGLHKSRGLTLVLITHDMEEATRMAERLVVLNRGRIVLQGRTAAVLAQPDAVRSAGLIPPPLVELAELLQADGLLDPAQAMSVHDASAAIAQQLG